MKTILRILLTGVMVPTFGVIWLFGCTVAGIMLAFIEFGSVMYEFGRDIPKTAKDIYNDIQVDINSLLNRKE